MIDKFLTGPEASWIFYKFATAEGIPVSSAEELLGPNAVASVRRNGADYLSFGEFFKAVGYHDAELCLKKDSAAPVLTHQDGKAVQG